MKSQKILDHSFARWQKCCTVMTDTTSKGQIKNPNRHKQVSYRLRHHFKNDPARERADIPQVARAVGLSQRWDEGGGLCSGSSTIRRFHIRNQRPADSEGRGQWI